MTSPRVINGLCLISVFPVFYISYHITYQKIKYLYVKCDSLSQLSLISLDYCTQLIDLCIPCLLIELLCMIHHSFSRI